MGRLTLSREAGQDIMIGDDIRISAVEIRGDKVRLCIEAPINIPVHRGEVYEAIRRERELNRRLTLEHDAMRAIQDK